MAALAPGVFYGSESTNLYTFRGDVTAPRTQQSNGEVLALLGWRFDTVSQNGDSHPVILQESEIECSATMDTYAFTRRDESLMPIQSDNLDFPSAQSRTEAYWRTLLADQ